MLVGKRKLESEERKKMTIDRGKASMYIYIYNYSLLTIIYLD